MDIAWSNEQKYLAEHLVDVARDPTVCRDLSRLHVGYLVIGEQRFWHGDGRRALYPGIHDPGSLPGFQLVDSDGDLKLYKITAC
jgi:hypothetical protein